VSVLKPSLIGVAFMAGVIPAAASTADWKDDARDRIDEHRKARLNLRVERFNGTPVDGADVHVRMQRHAFGFGTAVSEQTFRWQASPDNPRYREVIRDGYRAGPDGEFREMFSMATPENGLKWRNYEDSDQDRPTTRTIDELTDWGLDIRGHAMVWQQELSSTGYPGVTPDDVGQQLKYIADNPADPSLPARRDYVRGRINGHIADIGQQTYGTDSPRPVAEWDVLNEPVNHRAYVEALDTSGTPYTKNTLMSDWFRRAKLVAPDAKLMLNDNAILSGQSDGQRDTYHAIAQSLINQGAPLNGIGMQGHVFSHAQARSPQQVLQTLDRFGQLGVPLSITEFDIRGQSGWGDTSDEADRAKGKYFRDFLIAAFSHESVDAFTLWGFWDDDPGSEEVLFYPDWSLKPAGEAYVDLVLDEWWSDFAATSPETGWINRDAFRGEYVVDVTLNGQTQQFELMHNPTGSQTHILGLPQGFGHVPEPATVTLLAAGMVLMSRRRQPYG